MIDRSQTGVGGRSPLSVRGEPDAWTPPSASLATRRISSRSKGSSRATVVSPERRRYVAESHHELKGLLSLLAHPDVTHVVEQPRQLTWTEERALRRHTLDAAVILRDGRRLGVIMKPEALADKHDVRGLAKRIAAIARSYGYDGIIVRTEKQLHPDRFADALLINTARLDPDPDADAVIQKVAAKLTGPTAIRLVVGLGNIGERGFKAVVRLIAAGALVRIGIGRISADAVVDRAPATRETQHA